MKQGNESNLPTGIYIIRKDKSEVIQRLDELLALFSRRVPDGQVVAIFKDGCRKVIDFLADSFAETHVRDICQKIIHSYHTDNISLARERGLKIYCFLGDLRITIPHFVPINDLPSCRHLLDFSTEKAALMAIDLVDNGIVKAGSHVLSIGAELYHICKITDVHRYYSDLLDILEHDVADGWMLSSVELLLESKCREELEYCKLATLKTTGGTDKGDSGWSTPGY